MITHFVTLSHFFLKTLYVFFILSYFIVSILIKYSVNNYRNYFPTHHTKKDNETNKKYITWYIKKCDIEYKSLNVTFKRLFIRTF